MPSPAEQSAELMTWDELKEVAADGVTIGSHCVTHRVLATLSPEEQVFELQESRAVLEERLGLEIKSVAYPVGGKPHFTADTERLAALAGYRVAFSFESGVNPPRITNPWAVRRIPAPLNVPSLAAQIAWSPAGPSEVRA
jgi:peptidoglycan/xylan/chitin deacetylase (PgdA/CDA1 family)